MRFFQGALYIGRNVHGRIGIFLQIIKRYGVAVQKELLVDKVALRVNAQLVGPLHVRIHLQAELELLASVMTSSLFASA